MSIVYKVKDDVTSMDFIENGYEFLSPEIAGVEIMDEEVVYKYVKQAKSSEPVKYAIAMFNHPDWQVYNLSNGGEEFFKDFYGIEFELVWSEKNEAYVKRVVENKKLFDYLRMWRVEVNFTEKETLWLGFTVADATFPKIFYAKECLDKYCKKEINNLKVAGLIEEYEVENQ